MSRVFFDKFYVFCIVDWFVVIAHRLSSIRLENRFTDFNDDIYKNSSYFITELFIKLDTYVHFLHFMFIIINANISIILFCNTIDGFVACDYYIKQYI